MVAIEVPSLALLLSVVALAYTGWQGARCRCPDCGVHVQEERNRKLHQAQLAHDTEHKGFGWRAGEPDRYRCHSDYCERNPKSKE